MTGSRSDDEAHLAALLAVLAVAVAGAGAEGCANGAANDAANDGTRLQQWRARRLAALAGEGGTSSRPYVLPRRAGQRTRL